MCCNCSRDHANAAHLLGRVAFARGQREAAVALMRRAIASEPANAAFHFNLGLVFVALDQLHDAGACFQQAVILKPDYAEAWNNLGNAGRLSGRLDDAARMLSPRRLAARV